MCREDFTNIDEMKTKNPQTQSNHLCITRTTQKGIATAHSSIPSVQCVRFTLIIVYRNVYIYSFKPLIVV